jgi:hypothetical protein
MAGAKAQLLEAAWAVITSISEGARESAKFEEAAACLWLVIAHAYGAVVPEAELEAILECGLVQWDARILVPLCEYSAAGAPASGVMLLLAANVLASRPWVVAQIPPDFVRALAEVAAGHPEEMEGLLSYNRNAIERMRAAVQAVLI